MNKKTLLLFFVLLLVVSLFLSACSKHPPKECETAAQCMAVDNCHTATCSSQGKCVQVPKKDCCGNGVCEEKAGENPCSCNKDCKFDKTESGLCEGVIKLENPYKKGVFYDAAYTEYFCENDECVAGVPPDKIKNKQLLNDIKGNFYFEIVTTIPEPFVVNEGLIKFRVTLRDFNNYKVRGPVHFTDLQVLSGSELIAEKQIDETLSSLDDFFETQITLNPVLNSVEESRNINVRISYEAFNYDVRSEEKTPFRTFLQVSFNKVMFVDPSRVED